MTALFEPIPVGPIDAGLLCTHDEDCPVPAHPAEPHGDLDALGFDVVPSGDASDLFLHLDSCSVCCREGVDWCALYAILRAGAPGVPEWPADDEAVELC